MKASTKAQNLDLAFDALASKHRREVIYTLSQHPASISDLAEQRDLSLQAIHKHINVLVEAGMVTRKKSGRITFLTLKSCIDAGNSEMGEPISGTLGWRH